MTMHTPLRDLCKGRWLGILPAVGIDPRHLTGRHGPCPKCGGHDRFRFDDKDGRGTWICSQCGAGDGIALAMLVNGWDFKDAAERISPLAGATMPAKPVAARSEESLRDAMNRMWRAAVPVTAGDPVSLYLRHRGIVLDTYPTCLRYLEKCRYQGDEPRWYPAMIAKVQRPDGSPAILHRTYLTMEGRKAPVESPRRLMPGRIDKGCAVRLAPQGPTLGIAEGIETALSVSAIWGSPCWAAVSAGMMLAWEPPPEAAEIVVYADHDRGYAGQAAAYGLAHRLAMRKDGPRVRVEIPADAGDDWNDVLMAEKAA